MYIFHIISKRIFDAFFSFLGILILLPFLGLIAVAIKLDSIGPVIFKQARLGRFAKEFRIFKFRSMVQNAENMEGGLFNYENDPRVTRVGAFLRKTSLDELSQLFNIFLGQMSFVGPRPAVTYELGKIEDFDEALKKRFLVKPGVTGYAQINGRNSLSRDEKTLFDARYVDDFKKWGVLLDIIILARTVITVLRMEGSFERAENAEADAAKIEKGKN